MITHIRKFVETVLHQPRSSLTGLQRFVKYSMDLGWHCSRALMEDRATQMAAALTYRTIFSLIPFTVLALVMFRAFGGFSDVLGEDPEKALFDYFEISALSVQVADSPPTEAATTETYTLEIEPQQRTADDAAREALQKTSDAMSEVNISDIITHLNDRVSQVSFTSIGVVGFLLLIWAALALLVTVEGSFNYVYGCRTGRSWTMRIVVYWSIITLGPVLLAVSISLTGTVMQFTEDLPFLGPLIAWLSRFTSLAATWLLLLLMYTLIPSTTVRLRPAMIGALVAAILWEGAKFLLKLYISRAVGYSVLYGSLGLIPLFLYWVYVTWLIVLFGLEIAYTLQAMRGKNFKHQQRDDREGLYDPRWMIPLASAVAEAFEKGKSVTVEQLAERFSLPMRVVRYLVMQMEAAGFVHVMQDKELDRGVSLAKPAEQISLNELLELINKSQPRTIEKKGIPGASLLASMDEAQWKAVSGQSLASITVHPKA